VMLSKEVEVYVEVKDVVVEVVKAVTSVRL
jgi:hypothetical protein